MKSYDIEHLMRVTITTAVREYTQRGGNIHRLAVKAGLCDATVSKLAYNETKYPRLNTVVGCLSALGFTLEIQPMEPKEEGDTASAATTKNVHRFPSRGETRRKVLQGTGQTK